MKRQEISTKGECGDRSAPAGKANDQIAQEWQRTFDVMNDAIWVVDKESRIQRANAASEKLLDRPGSQILGRYCWEVMHGTEQPLPECPLLRARKSLHRKNLDLQVGEKWFDITVDPFLDAEGHFAGAIHVVKDITERKRVEDALRRSETELREKDRRKIEFLAMLSHELRNPLAAIATSLPILEQADPGSEVSRQTRAILDRQVAQMNRIIGDLLEISRIKRGKFHLEGVKRLDLNGLVEQEVKDYRAVFMEKGVSLEWFPAARPLWTDGDTARLRQVIENLLNNAAKFTPAGGKVTVSTLEEASASRAVIRVKDTGVGISPDLLGKLFEPFMQAPQESDRKQGGLGLGLSLVKGIAELHGGSVEVRSEGIGKGAEFVFYLRLQKEAAETAPVLEITACPKKRILIIEDHEDTALVLRWALEMRHHEVDVASDGEDGLRKARQFRPDVVLCDIGLPGMDGYEVAKAMRAEPDLKRIMLIALSGYAQPEDVAKAREAGFDRHLAKPATPEEIDQAMAGA